MRSGRAWPGTVRLGMAWLGAAWQGKENKARLGQVRYGLVGLGVVWRGKDKPKLGGTKHGNICSRIGELNSGDNR